MVTLRDIVETIMDRREQRPPKPWTPPFRLGEIFFPISRSENLALPHFPQWFRPERSAA
jgi:hypothetical protein